MNRRAIGNAGEDRACCYLKRKGWKILDRNVRKGHGEIDIIASKRGITSFVEVKQRSSDAFGSPAAAVTTIKQRRIIHASILYIQENGLEDSPVRFDVIEVFPDRINHIENAFDATDLY